MISEEIYVKGKSTVLMNDSEIFVYEVCIFCLYKNYYSLVNKVFYSSLEEVLHILSSYEKDVHTRIRCELYSAPLSWLIDNDYITYVKPDKTIKTVKKENNGKPQITINKRTGSSTATKTNRTRTKES